MGKPRCAAILRTLPSWSCFISLKWMSSTFDLWRSGAAALPTTSSVLRRPSRPAASVLPEPGRQAVLVRPWSDRPVARHPAWITKFAESERSPSSTTMLHKPRHHHPAVGGVVERAWMVELVVLVAQVHVAVR